MARLRKRVKTSSENYEHWDVGDEDTIDTDYGVNGREIRFHVKRGRYGWSVWVVNVIGQKQAPVSVGDYRGDNFDEVLRRIRRFVNGVHGRRS